MNAFLLVSNVAFILLMLSINSINSLVIKVPRYEELPIPNTFTCKEPGFIPNELDCQMFWYCAYVGGLEAEKNINETSVQESELLDPKGNLFQGARLYKCPDGYIYDETIKFCQPDSKVTCKYPRKKQNEMEGISPWGILNDFRCNF